MEPKKQKAIIVGVKHDNIKYDMEVSLRELKALAEACDVEVVDELVQNLRHVNLNTYIGEGKVSELLSLVHMHEADLIICNEELTPNQLMNLEEAIPCGILDRTYLILEIFASRAKTKEARLQVQIARLKYMIPRLIGMNSGIYSQQGGSGFRGAGETKLELDRRRIKHDLASLERELKEVVLQRQTQRTLRQKNEVPVVALVGYTNSGKSTLMNALVGRYSSEEKQVLAKDMLFATLETATRSIVLEDKKQFLLTDTVGFVDQLPHQLVKAFRSTLEEVSEADLLLHIVDASNPNKETQMAVTNKVLQEIGVTDIPMLYVFNKWDLSDMSFPIPSDGIAISALYNEHIDSLLMKIRSLLFSSYKRVWLQLPYEQGQLYSYLHSKAHILSEEQNETGYHLNVELKSEDLASVSAFIIK